VFTQSGACNRPKAINDAPHNLITINTIILHTKKEKWMFSVIITQLLVVLRVMKYRFVMFNTTECLKQKKKKYIFASSHQSACYRCFNAMLHFNFECSVITVEIIIVPRGWPVFYSGLNQLRYINIKLINFNALSYAETNHQQLFLSVMLLSFSCQIRSIFLFSSLLNLEFDSIVEPAGINIIRYLTNARAVIA
jgi:hypothetical protein